MEPEIKDEKYEALTREISSVLNKYIQENRSNTPDYMLAEFMLGCLNVYENTISKREVWFNRPDPLNNASPGYLHPNLNQTPDRPYPPAE